MARKEHKDCSGNIYGTLTDKATRESIGRTLQDSGLNFLATEDGRFHVWDPKCKDCTH